MRRNIIHRHARLRSGAGFHSKRDNNNERKAHMALQTMKDFRAEHGIYNGSDLQAALEEWSADSVVPAMCDEGCEVEPDGECEHGCPSILVRMGLI